MAEPTGSANTLDPCGAQPCLQGLGHLIVITSLQLGDNPTWRYASTLNDG